VLVAQDRQRPGGLTEVGAAGGEEGAGGRSITPRTASTRRRRPRRSRTLLREVAQGGREDHRGPRRIVGVLRLPGRALDPPAHDESDRVDVRHRAAAAAGDQGARLQGHRTGVAMAFKLIESAQARWRAVNAPHLVALVRAGATSEKDVLVERPDEQAGGDQQVT